MFFVELGQQIELVALDRRRDRRRGLQVDDRRPLSRDLGAAIGRRQPTVLPQQRAARVVALGVAQHEIRWQAAILGAESVAHPRTQRRPPRKDLARVEHHQRFRVIVVLRIHRPHQAQFIRQRSELRQQRGHLGAALAVLAKRQRRGHQLVGVAHLKRLDRHRLAGAFREFRFWIEQVHLTRTTILHEHHDRFGSRLKVRLLRREARGSFRRDGVVVRDPPQRERAKSQRRRRQHLPARERTRRPDAYVRSSGRRRPNYIKTAAIACVTGHTKTRWC